MTILLLSLVPALAAILYGVLLFATWRHGLHSKPNRRFAWYLISMIIWSIGALMMYLDRTHATAWNRVMLAGATMMPLTFFSFVHAFLGQRRFETWLPIGVLLYFSFLALNVAGLLATDIAVSESGVIHYRFGPAIPLFSIYYASFIGAASYSLVRALRASRDFVVVNRTKFVFIGLIFVLIGSTTNIFNFLGSYPLDIAANALNAAIIAYVIFRYQLIDIDIVFRKGLLYSIPTGIIGVGYFLVISLAVNLLHLVAGYQVLIVSLVVAGVAAVFIQPLRDVTQAWVDKSFYREKYDFAQMIQRLSRTAVSVLDLDRLADMILNELTQTMHAITAAVVLIDKDSQTYQLRAQRGLPGDFKLTMRSDNPIVAWMAGHHDLLSIEDVEVLPRFRGLWGQERAELEAAKVALFLPLKTHGELVGLIILGPKRSGIPYAPDEHLNLITLANQTAIAVQNALLYQTTLEEKRRAETILQEAFAGIIVLDRDLHVQTMNPSAEAITGFRANEIAGRSLIEFFDLQMWDEGSPLFAALQDQKVVPPAETALIGARGRRDVLMGVTPLPDGYLLNFIDITRMKEIDRLKSNIVASVSHELRTPLTSIKGYTDLLMGGYAGDDLQLRHQFLTIIGAETDRLVRFVNDLLDLTRLESGRSAGDMDDVFLDEVVRESVRTLSVQAEQSHVQILTVLPDDLPAVHASKHLMAGMVKNLISNAIKFSPSGGQVRVTLQEAPSTLLFEVADEGIGIAPEDLPHLFSKFYRSESAWRSGIKGTGLGLALVKETVEMHHGQIAVESKLGEGTRFLVSLPTATNQAPATNGGRQTLPTAA